MTEPTVTPEAWRGAMGAFPSGVTIVTSWDDKKPVGSTVSSFCSVSLDPPLLLVSLAYYNPVRAPLRAAGVFGVNFLPEGGGELAGQFATPGDMDKFDGVDYAATPGGAPRLKAATVYIECVLHDAHMVADHELIIGRGRAVEMADKLTPLAYFQGGFMRLAKD